MTTNRCEKPFDGTRSLLSKNVAINFTLFVVVVVVVTVVIVVIVVTVDVVVVFCYCWCMGAVEQK